MFGLLLRFNADDLFDSDLADLISGAHKVNSLCPRRESPLPKPRHCRDRSAAQIKHGIAGPRRYAVNPRSYRNGNLRGVQSGNLCSDKLRRIVGNLDAGELHGSITCLFASRNSMDLTEIGHAALGILIRTWRPGDFQDRGAGWRLSVSDPVQVSRSLVPKPSSQINRCNPGQSVPFQIHAGSPAGFGGHRSTKPRG